MIPLDAAAAAVQGRQDDAMLKAEITDRYLAGVARYGRPFAFWMWRTVLHAIVTDAEGFPADPAADPRAAWAWLRQSCPPNLWADGRAHLQRFRRRVT